MHALASWVVAMTQCGIKVLVATERRLHHSDADAHERLQIARRLVGSVPSRDTAAMFPLPHSMMNIDMEKVGQDDSGSEERVGAHDPPSDNGAMSLGHLPPRIQALGASVRHITSQHITSHAANTDCP